MDFDDFLEFLKKWVSEINEFNNREKGDFFLLDKDYFDFDKDKHAYSINETAIESWKIAKLIFIADNPGTKEKEHFTYLYYDKNDEYIGFFRSAGYKYHNFLRKIDIKETESVKFNKCLISTSKTSDLRKEQISTSKKIVKDFLTNFVLFNDKVFVLFSGITGIHKGNSKFSELYDELKNVINAENCGFVGHISRKCFPKKLSGEMSFEKIKELSKAYKKYLFFCNSSNMDRHNCQGCALYKYCHDNNDPDDSLYVNP